MKPKDILGLDTLPFLYPYRPEDGENVALCVGHMFDSPGRSIPRFPVSGGVTALAAYTDQLWDIDGKHPIDTVVTGGTHGGDSFAVLWALLNNRRLVIVRPYDEHDHLNARVPDGNSMLAGLYRFFEKAFQKSVERGLTHVVYPYVDQSIATEVLNQDEFDLLAINSFVPSKAIAEKVGLANGNQWLCYDSTNAMMLSLLSGATSMKLYGCSLVR